VKSTELICTADAARKLGYTLQHTRLLIRKGQLDAIKIGRDWVIERRTLLEFSAQYRGNKIRGSIV
jgi:excisionase family DNA binding protein